MARGFIALRAREASCPWDEYAETFEWKADSVRINVLKREFPLKAKLLTLMFIVLSFAVGGTLLAQTRSGEEEAELDRLIREALERNPEIREIRHEVDSLEASVSASRRWKDPVLGVEYSNVPWTDPVLSTSPMSGLQFRIQQTLPAPGINDARMAVSRARVDVQTSRLDEVRSQLVATVRAAYWRLADVRAQEDVTRRHIALVDELYRAVQGRYQAGFANQGALLRLQLLRERLRDGLDDYRRDERTLTAALNAACSMPPERPIQTPALQAALKPPGESPASFVEEGMARRGRLKQRRAEEVLARREVELAKRGRWTEFNVWAGYRVRSDALSDGGADFITIGVSGTLPFDYTKRWESEARAARLRAEAARDAHQRVLDQLAADVEAVLAQWERAYQRHQRYQRSLVPTAEDTVESTLASYRTGRATFESLYQAEAALLELERTLLSARLETFVAQARLRALVGHQD